jgi:hypothetical protein
MKLIMVRALGSVTVRDEDDGRFLVPFVDHVVEVLGTGRAQRAEPEVVEDDEIGAGVVDEALLVVAQRGPRRGG